MSLEDKKITGFSKPVSAMPDVPGAAGYTAAQVKEWFDSNSSVELKNSVNGIIDFLLGFTNGEEIKGIRLNEDNVIEVTTDGKNYISTGYSKAYIIDMLSEKANKSDVLLKTNTEEFTPTGIYQPATKKYVDDKIVETGAADMTQAVYDPTGRQTDIFAYAEHLVGSRVINSNLIDNWYFVNPVNQRGLTEYSGLGYGIDRWMSTLNPSKYALGEEGIIVSSGNFRHLQILENAADLVGRKLTVSFLISENTATANFAVGQYVDGTQGATIVSVSNKATGCVSGTFTASEGFEGIYLYNTSAFDGTVVIAAVKLEYGDTQTLAHQDAERKWVLNEIPNYAEQLAICKQYDPYTGEYIGFNYLPLTGGTLTGNLQIKKSAPEIVMTHTANNRYLNVFVGSDGIIYFRNAADGNNRTAFFLNPETADNLARLFRLQKMVNGTATYYDVYGQHNKPSGSYTGNGSDSERKISVGGAGDVLLVRNGKMCYFVTPEGIRTYDGDSTSSYGGTTYIDGVLTLGQIESNLNIDGEAYYYTVL